MCLLTFYPADVLPDTDALLNGAYLNDDGHGFAIVTGRRIIVRHGMDAEYMVAEFDRVRRRYAAGPALFHSRLGTHGSVTKTNCHPFRLGGDSRTVLAHNGILPTSVQPRRGDRRSDTRIAAEVFLPSNPFGSLGSRRGRDRLAKWLTPGNKMVILTVDPRYRHSAYVLNEEHGIWDHGVWYSNDGYLPLERHWGTVTEREAWLATLVDEQCGTCGEVGGIDRVRNLCQICGACLDCSQEHGICVCYLPVTVAG